MAASAPNSQQLLRVSRGLPDWAKGVYAMTEPKKPRSSDPRFRSFAERWVAARCHLFRQEFIQADTWECVQQAATAYKMIRMVGFNTFEDEDGPSF